MIQKIVNSLKKTIVFIGKYDKNNEEIFPVGSGFLIRKEGILLLVTAKHIIYDKKSGNLKDKEMFIFVNIMSNQIGIIPINHFKNEFRTNWFFHPYEIVDIAILPISHSDNMDIKVIPFKRFLSVNQFSELFDVFYLSYQPNVIYYDRINPILRTGTVSRINDDDTFLIDGFSFKGNSGSPVFTRPEHGLQKEDIVFLDEDKGGLKPFGFNLIGVIGGYVPYDKLAIGTQGYVLLEHNTGLSLVWSSDFILEILEDEDFLSLFNEIKEKYDKSLT